MNLQNKVTIPAQVMASQPDDELVILDLASNSYFGLNPVGATIWHFLSEGKTLAETCHAMVNKYDVAPDEIERDVVQLTNELVTKKLLQIQ
jgi:hypothetical protein